jgi:hypothetical protein
MQIRGNKDPIPMLRRTALRRSLARLMLGCLLFTQAALAVVPCVSAGASAANAFAATAPECHDAPPPNLCLAQCVAWDQSSGPAPALLAPPPSWTIEVLPVAPMQAPAGARFDSSLQARALGPPPFLRLCSLLL